MPYTLLPSIQNVLVNQPAPVPTLLQHTTATSSLSPARLQLPMANARSSPSPPRPGASSILGAATTPVELDTAGETNNQATITAPPSPSLSLSPSATANAPSLDDALIEVALHGGAFPASVVTMEVAARRSSSSEMERIWQRNFRKAVLPVLREDRGLMAVAERWRIGQGGLEGWVWNGRIAHSSSLSKGMGKGKERAVERRASGDVVHENNTSSKSKGKGKEKVIVVEEEEDVQESAEGAVGEPGPSTSKAKAKGNTVQKPDQSPKRKRKAKPVTKIYASTNPKKQRRAAPEAQATEGGPVEAPSLQSAGATERLTYITYAKSVSVGCTTSDEEKARIAGFTACQHARLASSGITITGGSRKDSFNEWTFSGTDSTWKEPKPLDERRKVKQWEATTVGAYGRGLSMPTEEDLLEQQRIMKRIHAKGKGKGEQEEEQEELPGKRKRRRPGEGNEEVELMEGGTRRGSKYLLERN